MNRFAVAMLVVMIGCRQADERPVAPLENLPEIDLTGCEEKLVARVGGADQAPVIVKRVDPAYPTDAPRGIVIVETVITRSGDICAARVLRGLDAATDQAALRAVRRWKFVPAKKKGQPVQAAFNISMVVE